MLGPCGHYLNLVLLYVALPLLFLVVLFASMVHKSRQQSAERSEGKACKMPDWENEKVTGMRFTGKSLLRTYRHKKTQMETAIELYFAERIDFLDTKRVMHQRYDLLRS